MLQVNGVDVRQSSHHDAVVALISAPSSVVIDVRHDPQPPALQVTSALLSSYLQILPDYIQLTCPIFYFQVFVEC